MAAAPSASSPTPANLSRSVAYLDVAGLVGAGVLVAGVAAAARRSAAPARVIFAALGAVATPLALALRLGQRSGVTAAELRRPLPGDDLVPIPRFVTGSSRCSACSGPSQPDTSSTSQRASRAGIPRRASARSSRHATVTRRS